MTDPLAPDAPPAPQPRSPDDAAARSFRLMAALQVAPIKPPRRCFLPDLARQPTRNPSPPEITRP